MLKRSHYLLTTFTAVVILALGGFDASAQPASTESLSLVVNADQGEHTISRHIYGHFAEHLGRGIYGGFWVKDEAGEWHLRDDVIEALRQIDIPNLRWPGGCFADTYHWKDGIGPRAERPTIINTHWGGVTEDNSFGTHEFMALIDRLDAEPFFVGNVGSGTVEELAQWVEYVNFDGVSPMADLRRQNGREEPWGIRYWGVGNETWGCGGNMQPEFYANVYRRYVTYVRSYGGTEPIRVAVGPPGEYYEWTEVLMQEAGDLIDGIDLHHYTVVGTWADKGSAIDFSEREWFVAMQKALHMDEILTQHSNIMDRYDPEKRVALIVGEWGMWHDPHPGSNPGFLYQQNTLRDALVAAVSLNIFNQHAERVRMANIAQTINVLQAMILTRDDEMILTPTYHVFDMYKAHQDAMLLPISLDGGQYEHNGDSIPAVSASASRDQDGTVHITLTNLDPNEARTIAADIRGEEVSQVTGRILTASAMNAHNTFEQPGIVKPAPFEGAQLEEEMLTVALPSKSVVVLTLE